MLPPQRLSLRGRITTLKSIVSLYHSIPFHRVASIFVANHNSHDSTSLAAVLPSQISNISTRIPWATAALPARAFIVRDGELQASDAGGAASYSLRFDER